MGKRKSKGYKLLKKALGGTTCPEGFVWNGSDCVDASIDFLKQMTNSPLFNERYSTMTNNPLGDISNEANNYKQFINNNLNTVKIGDWENSDKGNWNGVYYPEYTDEDKSTLNNKLQSFQKEKQNFISNHGLQNINTNSYLKDELKGFSQKINKYRNQLNNPHTVFINQNQDLPATKIHELSHASTIANKGLNYSNSPFTMDINNLPDNFKQIYSKDKEYYEKPTEIKARVDAVRKWMMDNKVYDPVNEKFEKKHYDKLKEQLQSSPVYDINKESGFQSQMQDLMIPFKEEDVIRMFNSFVKNENPSSVQTAKYGGTINNDMRKRKNKKLPIDNGLPKAYWGAILNTVLPQLAGAGAGAMTGATAGMASGAANGLAGATGAGGGLGSLTSGAGGGLQSLGSKAAGSLQGNMNKDTLGSLGKGMDVLSPLVQETTKAVMGMVNSFITPEENYRTTLKNTGAHYANGGEISIKPSKRGTFTKAAKQRGMGVQQFASKVLANKDNYSPAMVKKANFARNAAKWKKAMGGIVEPEIFEIGGQVDNILPYEVSRNSNNALYSDMMQDRIPDREGLMNYLGNFSDNLLQQKLNQSLQKQRFDNNLKGTASNRNNVGVGYKAGPFTQTTSITNDRRLAPFKDFSFASDNPNSQLNVNTRLGYKDKYGFKGSADYTNSTAKNDPNAKFNLGFNKYGVTGDYNYNYNKENPNFNLGAGYSGNGVDANFKASKSKEEDYNYDANFNYDNKGVTSNFGFIGNRETPNYTFGAGYTNEPTGLSGTFSGDINKDNRNYNFGVGYTKDDLTNTLGYNIENGIPNFDYLLNYSPSKGFNANANLKLGQNDIDLEGGLGYKNKKFNTDVSFKRSINPEEETNSNTLRSNVGYKGKNFNTGINYEREFATEENPATNKVGLNVGYNRNGFGLNAGVNYKTLSEAQKEKDKASPFEVTAGVRYTPKGKAKQKTTPLKLSSELTKKVESMKPLINEKQLSKKDRELNELKKKLALSKELAKKAYGGYMDAFDAMGYGGNVYDHPDYSDYMALGGIMGGGNPTLPPLKPATASDSLAVYNSAMNFQNQMENLGYKKAKTASMFDAYNEFMDKGQFALTDNKLKVKAPDKKLEQVRLTGTAAAKYPNKQVKDVGNFYSNKKVDDYKYNVAELLSHEGYNTDLPYQLVDERIAPQGVSTYHLNNPEENAFGDVAVMLSYDPLAVKPYAMRTPQEQAQVQKRYSTGNQPTLMSSNNITPVTDLRRDTKDYLKTLENLDDKNNFIEYLRSGTLTGEETRALTPMDIQRRANAWKSGMAYGGMVDPLMAFGGMIDPTMAMQQMMYGSYAQGGQVPQNIPVEVEGEEMYEMPNGETGEFSGPKHENGGIPIALPEGTKIYSDRLKVNGKTMAARKDKREANINKLEKLLTKNPNDKFIKEALKRQQETASLEEQGDMQMQEQANQQQQMEEMAMEEMLMGAAQQDMQEGMMAMGGMIKRADGSYSKRGLWDNIRANRGSGKKPTKEMLKQEKKIRAAEKAYGGMIKYAPGGTVPPYGLMSNQFFGQPTTQVSGYNPLMMTDENYLNYLNSYNQPNLYSLRPNEFPLETEPTTLNTETYTGLQPQSLYTRSVNPNIETPLNYNVETYTGIPDNVQSIVSSKGFPGNFQNLPSAKLPTSAYTPTLNYSGVEVPNQQPKSNFITNLIDNISDIDLLDMFTRKPKQPKESKKSTSKNVKSNNEEDVTEDKLRYTEGDRTGMAGTAAGMYGPTMMTLLNRLETPPNKNFFNTFGQDALRTQMEAEGIAGQAKDEAYRKNVMRANALRNAIANSARGVGDMRTQQLTAALTEQEGGRDILNSYLQSMSGLKGQRANLQAQIDQTRMGGEYQRDLADRQDVDQFYTNLAENLTGVSEGMQKIGKDKNIAQRNKDILSLSKHYSPYGIYVDYNEKGGLSLKYDGKEITEKEADVIMKKKLQEKNQSGTTEANSFPALDFQTRFNSMNNKMKLNTPDYSFTKRKR